MRHFLNISLKSSFILFKPFKGANCAVEGRSRTDKLSLILQSAENGVTRTVLMYETHLSYEALKEYLSLLTAEGLLRYLQGEMKFKTTDSGLKYLSRLTGDRVCTHQCKKCGNVYRCDSLECEKLFQDGLCLQCASVLTSGFGIGEARNIGTIVDLPESLR